MSTTTTSADDLFMSLNGFDEIGIAKAFDADVFALKKKPFMFLRALVFVDQKRNGANHEEAKKAALLLTIDELNDYFPEHEDEVMPDEPETEAGKDDSQTV